MPGAAAGGVGAAACGASIQPGRLQRALRAGRLCRACGARPAASGTYPSCSSQRQRRQRRRWGAHLPRPGHPGSSGCASRLPLPAPLLPYAGARTGPVWHGRRAAAADGSAASEEDSPHRARRLHRRPGGGLAGAWRAVLVSISALVGGGGVGGRGTQDAVPSAGGLDCCLLLRLRCRRLPTCLPLPCCRRRRRRGWRRRGGSCCACACSVPSSTSIAPMSTRWEDGRGWGGDGG